MRSKFNYLFLFLLTSFSLFAEKEVKVEGVFTLPVPNYMSPAEAEERAIENARFEALRKQFGVAHGSQTIMVGDITGEHSNAHAFIHSVTETNGDWIKDLEEPVITKKETVKGFIDYTVHIKGLARKLEHQPIDIDARLLCNGCDKTRDILRGNQYIEGDNFYIYFCSPVSGWLTVYLQDCDDDMTMQAILPYDGQKEKAYPIEADKEYIFFSVPHAEESVRKLAGGLKMYARNKTDFNIVHLIFSPNEFSRSSIAENTTSEITARIGDETVNLMPRETTFKKFNNWLSKSRLKDPQMQVNKYLIYISKEK